MATNNVKTYYKCNILRYTLTIHYMDEKQQPISRTVLNLETHHIYTYRNGHDSKKNSVCTYLFYNL